jgi:hypothetical protein
MALPHRNSRIGPLLRSPGNDEKGVALMKRLTTLGVATVAAGALALGGAASPAAGSTCSYQSNWHITKRHNVSCKTAKKVFGDYYNNGPNADGTLKHHPKWHCPKHYNAELGKCWKGTDKKNPDASFRYKSGY